MVLQSPDSPENLSGVAKGDGEVARLTVGVAAELSVRGINEGAVRR